MEYIKKLINITTFGRYYDDDVEEDNVIDTYVMVQEIPNEYAKPINDSQTIHRQSMSQQKTHNDIRATCNAAQRIYNAAQTIYNAAQATYNATQATYNADQETYNAAEIISNTDKTTYNADQTIFNEANDITQTIRRQSNATQVYVDNLYQQWLHIMYSKNTSDILQNIHIQPLSSQEKYNNSQQNI